jgi:DNA/RNA-binding protein KIN17
MPRAEVGSTKYIANKLKSKGLQRLRWYCQVCERQMRDENGFKCHVASETHVRQMLVVGANPNKAINEYSKQFQHDFIQQLRTAHGTKAVHINHFYQEYIGNKEHVHMNSTKWPSLTEFAKFVGREGICRVEETDKGLHVAWIDNSPEALRRQDAIRKKERQDKGDEEREQRLIQDQVERAHDSAKTEYENDRAGELNRPEGEKIVLNFGSKASASKLPTPPQESDEKGAVNEALNGVPQAEDGAATALTTHASPSIAVSKDEEATAPFTAPLAIKLSLSAAGTNKPKNVFAAKKNPLAGKKSAPVEQPKKMSEAERIMKEELERKRGREVGGNVSFGMKRQRVG